MPSTRSKTEKTVVKETKNSSVGLCSTGVDRHFAIMIYDVKKMGQSMTGGG